MSMPQPIRHTSTTHHETATLTVEVAGDPVLDLPARPVVMTALALGSRHISMPATGRSWIIAW
jgi:hypothetical protein